MLTDTSDQHADAIEKLRASSYAYQDAHRRRDFTSLAELYASDAVVLPHTHEVLHGAEAVCGFYREAMRRGLLASDMTVEPSCVEVVGDLGYVGGTWTAIMPTADGAAIREQGFYLDVLKRIGEGWKIVCETWNVKPH